MEEKEQADIEGLLAEGRRVQISPRGWSMYPLIVPGRDEVRIAPLGEKRPRRGDVVLFRRRETPVWNSRIKTNTPEGQLLVIHRIWRCREEGYYLVGDNQKLVEGPIAPDQLRGILEGVVRKGRYIPVTNRLYRVCACLWLVLRPVRPLLSKTVAFFKRL